MRDAVIECKKQSAMTFDGLAEAYDRSGFGQCHPGWDETLLPVLQNARPKSILDVGCGTGAFLAHFAAQTDVLLAGVDISPGMAACAAKRLGARADVRVGDSESLPWRGETFDAVVCIASFHHYPNPTQVLREMHRVLRPTGRVYLADLRLVSPVRQAVNLVIPFLRTGDVRMYSEGEIHLLACQAGFHPAGCRILPGSGFLCVLEKNKEASFSSA